MISKARIDGGKGDVRVRKHFAILPYTHRFYERSIETFCTKRVWLEHWYTFELHDGTRYKQWNVVDKWTCTKPDLEERLSLMRDDLEYQEVPGSSYVAYFSRLPHPRKKLVTKPVKKQVEAVRKIGAAPANVETLEVEGEDP